MNWKYAFIVCSFAAAIAARGQGTAFTYQGRLNSDGNPARGSYDFRFKLFEDPDGNNQVGSAFLANGVSVTNGLFMATVDFGPGVFNGSNYWLQVGVRTNGGVYQDLNPLQPVLPTPYATFANSASSLVGPIPSLSLSGTYGSPVVFNNGANSFGGAFSGNGANVTNVNAATLNGLAASNFWNLAGNAGTTPGVNFLGTSDNQPLEVRVNNQRALQLLPDNSTNGAPEVVGGSISNGVSPGLVGNTIAGGSWNTIGPIVLLNSNNPYGDIGAYDIGASYSTIGGGFLNQIQAGATFSTIAGGAINTIQASNIQSTIGGGFGNTILAKAPWSTIAGGTHHSVYSQNGFIGGGWENTIQSNSSYATIGGGFFNVVGPNAFASMVGGGYNNIIGPDGSGNGGTYSVIGGGYFNRLYEYDSFIGGGQQNLIGSSADHSIIGGGFGNVINGSAGPVYGFVGGGANNTIQTNSAYAFIGGGNGNTVQSNSSFATIAGGNANVAGRNGSFAAGTFAQATNDGTFVWADTSGGVFNSTSSNQFLIRAAGGVGIGTNNPAAALQVAGDASGTNMALRISSGGIAVSGAGLLTPTAAFVHVANSTNISVGYITVIYNPLCDNDPNALLFVTHNWNPVGVLGNYETHPYSVYYDDPHWAIYNDDRASISNMSFNVLVIKQ